MKSNKGITLIALVITIVVLLILAGVSITALTDEDKGVVTKAKKAAKDTEEAAEQEDEDINEILDYAENAHLLSFKIVSKSGTTKTYYAELGMTWEEWKNSDYNTDGYKNIDGDGIISDPTGEYWLTEDADGNNQQYFTDKIEDGFTYYQYTYGEGPSVHPWG